MERLELSWPAALGHVTKISIADATVAPALYDAAALGHLVIDFPASHRPQLKELDKLTVSFERPHPKLAQSPYCVNAISLSRLLSQKVATLIWCRATRTTMKTFITTARPGGCPASTGNYRQRRYRGGGGLWVMGT